jgi:hypothetical protein
MAAGLGALHAVVEKDNEQAASPAADARASREEASQQAHGLAANMAQDSRAALQRAAPANNTGALSAQAPLAGSGGAADAGADSNVSSDTAAEARGTHPHYQYSKPSDLSFSQVQPCHLITAWQASSE